MNRQEKQQVINNIKNDFKTSQASFIVYMQGMTVEDVQQLRRQLHAKHGTIKVAKNTLLKKATSDIAGLSDLPLILRSRLR